MPLRPQRPSRHQSSRAVTNPDRPAPLSLALETPARVFFVAAPQARRPNPSQRPCLLCCPNLHHHKHSHRRGSSSSLDAAACEPQGPRTESEVGGRESWQRKSVNPAEADYKDVQAGFARRECAGVRAHEACAIVRGGGNSECARIWDRSAAQDAKAYISVLPDDDNDEDGEESDV
ncbi:hypothetical protein B0H15DRAFT_819863 [Mycena belliarum]|uniref:Uncharacterized protein n=1 Tax=Mycena belliarum TaxID=1033014 RepID=A0AAD6UJU6_9AGAR|nr:hypothetical protein B0H15DRAFT_819863 [Mycena belliae]